MKFGVAALTMIGLTALGAMRPALGAQQQTTTPGAAAAAATAQSPDAADAAKTIWSGVFTDEQARRGKALYTQYCQSCHGPDLGGGEMAPPLTGSIFLTNWDGQTVGDLEERVRVTMPQGDEGSLSRQQVVDILSAIFAANQAPAGQTELSHEVAFLKQIKITPKQ